MKTPSGMPFQIVLNHVGYDVRGSKRFVVQGAADIAFPDFRVLDGGGRVAWEGPLLKCGQVAGWKGRFFQQGDFTALNAPGTYCIQVGDVCSAPFTIRERLLPESCLADLIYFFRIQRCSGAYDKADRSLVIFGEPDRPRVDVHGGWYDASGDVSKYLSHLSEANYMNPQQTPLAVWAFLEVVQRLKGHKVAKLRSLVPIFREEALYGADFLVRMQDQSGYFHASVHDACTHDPAKRDVCGYKGLAHVKHGETKAAFREGGGLAIAALARMSTINVNGDYTPEVYRAAAEKGFQHLLAHNLEYADDHRENILDDYCVLLAATELYNATKQARYLEAARGRAESLVNRLSKDNLQAGWWRADEDGTRPFFHACDAGLPVVALMRYLQIEDDPGRKAPVEKAVMDSMRFELKITDEVVNPFGYARQYVKDAGGGKRCAFFMPHNNETGYWWQGENARLGSLAAAALQASLLAPPGFAVELRAYAVNQVNWILGLNPLDMCMMQGKGRNNPDSYEGGAPNPPGGICNGFTSGEEDEQDIAYKPGEWRWSEQWLPHAAWLILALVSEVMVSDAT